MTKYTEQKLYHQLMFLQAFWRKVKLTEGEGRCMILDRSPVTGPETNSLSNNTHIHTYGQFTSHQSSKCASLDCVRKPNLEFSQAATGRTCRLHTDRPHAQGSNPKPSWQHDTTVPNWHQFVLFCVFREFYATVITFRNSKVAVLEWVFSPQWTPSSKNTGSKQVTCSITSSLPRILNLPTLINIFSVLKL